MTEKIKKIKEQIIKAEDHINELKENLYEAEKEMKMDSLSAAYHESKMDCDKYYYVLCPLPQNYPLYLVDIVVIGKDGAVKKIEKGTVLQFKRFGEMDSITVTEFKKRYLYAISKLKEGWKDERTSTNTNRAD